MSLQFSDTTNYKGIVQIYEKEIGLNRGDISGNVNKLKELTADINLAMDDYTALALSSSGSWEFDDSNHTDYPIMTTNLVSGQRDYTFTTDGSGTLVLDIYKVLVADNVTGYFRELWPVDAKSTEQPYQGVGNQSGVLTDWWTGADGFTNGRNQTGVPLRYDKTANGILLDWIPSYNSVGGLKVYINREGSYFVYTDTIKMPGVPGLHHRYFALKPAVDYARRNNLQNYPTLLLELQKMEGDESKGIIGSIQRYFGRRAHDTHGRMISNYSSNK